MTEAQTTSASHTARRGFWAQLDGVILRDQADLSPHPTSTNLGAASYHAHGLPPPQSHIEQSRLSRSHHLMPTGQQGRRRSPSATG